MDKVGTAEGGGQQVRNVFVSHSSKDGKLASQVVKILEQMGATCWVAPRDILSGKQYNQAILDAIKDSSVFLLILSDDSNQSPHVEVEVERAFHYQKTIIPLRIREVMPSKKLEYFISNAQWVDAFASPLHERLEHVAAVVKALEMNSSMPAIPAERPSFAGKIRKTLEAGQRNMLAVASVAMIFFGAATFLTVKYAPANGVSATQMESALSDVERQTSSDPRKELAKRGINWHPFDFLNAAQAGQLEEVQLFRKAGMNSLVDYSSTCFGIELLLFNYSGPPEVEENIWGEVVDAIGDKKLKACLTISPLYDAANGIQGNYSPQAKQNLQGVVDFYKKTYVKANPRGWSSFAFKDASPLVAAVWMGNDAVVKTLLQHGVDPNHGVKVIEDDGHPINVDISPLAEAKRIGNVKIIQTLKEYGAKEIRSGIPWQPPWQSSRN